MRIRPITEPNEIVKYRARERSMNQIYSTARDNWYEVRADGETVFNSPVESEAFEFLEDTRLTLHRNKVMQVAEVWKCQTKNEKGQPSFTLNGLKEKIIHEEHPTVLEERPPTGCDYGIGG